MHFGRNKPRGAGAEDRSLGIPLGVEVFKYPLGLIRKNTTYYILIMTPLLTDVLIEAVAKSSLDIKKQLGHQQIVVGLKII